MDGVAFTGFANLTGGSGDDVFQFANGATVSGVINGEGVPIHLDYSAYIGGVTVNLGNATTGLANSSATWSTAEPRMGSSTSARSSSVQANTTDSRRFHASVIFTATGNGNNILVAAPGAII